MVLTLPIYLYAKKTYFKLKMYDLKHYINNYKNHQHLDSICNIVRY